MRVNVADKRIFGGTTDVNQMLPLRYPWAWEAYLEANKNHWTSSDFSFASAHKVGGQPNMMTQVPAREYLVTELAFAWHLIVSEVVSTRLFPVLYRSTTAPECRQYMLRMMEEDETAKENIPLTPYPNLRLPHIQKWIDGQVDRLAADLAPYTNKAEIDLFDYVFVLCTACFLKRDVVTAHYNYLMKEGCTEVKSLVALLQRDVDKQADTLGKMVEALRSETSGPIGELIDAVLKSWSQGASFMHWDSHNLDFLAQHTTRATVERHVETNTGSLEWD